MDDRSKRPLGERPRRMTTPAIMVPATWLEHGTGLDDALEQIFHPERFDARREEGHVDEGKFFHVASEGGGMSDAAAANAPFQRTMSMVDAPVADLAFKKGITRGALHNQMKAAGHHKDLYSQTPHHVLQPRMRKLPRADTDSALSTQKQAAAKGSRRPRKLSADGLPTIQDDAENSSSVVQDESDDDEPYRSLQQSAKGFPFEKRAAATKSVPCFLYKSVAPIPEEGLDEDSSSRADQQPPLSRALKTSHNRGGSGKHAAFSIAPAEDTEDEDLGADPRAWSRYSSKDSADAAADAAAAGWDKKVSFHARTGSDDSRDDNEAVAERDKKKWHKRRPKDPLGLARSSEASMDGGEEEAAAARGGLPNRDVDGMASHRTDELSRYGRRRLSRRLDSVVSAYHISGVPANEEQEARMTKLVERMFGSVSAKAHPDLFVEMDELEGDEWVEKARWIKYEEDREEGAERWGRPHVSTLTFHSLINLRLCLEGGVMLLDLEARDVPGIVYRVVEEMGINDIIDEDQKAEALRTLLFKHRYVNEKGFSLIGIKRNMSQKSLNSADEEAPSRWLRPFSRENSSVWPRHDGGSHILLRSQDSAIFNKQESRFFKQYSKHDIVGDKAFEKQSLIVEKNQNIEFTKHNQDGVGNGTTNRDGEQLVIDMSDEHATHGHPASAVASASSSADLHRLAQYKKDSIQRCLKDGTEGAIALVGALRCLDQPACAFVRLADATIMQNSVEIPVPMRFVFILLTPKPSPNIDYHEVGRSFCTLMSNPAFQSVCYQIEERRELLSAINTFLDESVVLPPGDWESRNLLSMEEIQDQRKRRRRKMQESEVAAGAGADGEDKPGEEKGREDGGGGKDEKEYPDPLERTRAPFGGMINDIKRRFPWYWSDIKDAVNSQCFGAIFFIFFACLSPAVAFGGLYGDKTENFIGVPVCLLVTSVTGCIFALLSAHPLLIVGITGPILVFDEAFYNFSKGSGVEFLPWRVWTSFWLVIIALSVAAFSGSTLVKFFSKFTKDIFSALIALIYIYEALKKLGSIFSHNPVTTLEVYCNSSVENTIHSINSTLAENYAFKKFDELEFALFKNVTSFPSPASGRKEPNAALLSFILMIGTFMLAYFLKIFRNGKYLGRTVRRALGDFGVPLSIVFFVSIDILLADTFTQKLKVPDGLQLTAPEKRGWIISPFGIDAGIQVWAPFAAVIPAMLLYLLLFMETHIGELLLLEKANKKGGGVHWDIVLICILNVFAAIIGGPWICGACVRSVTHLAALTVMSTTHAPGETAKVVNVYDQRATAFFVSVFVGLAVLLSSVLKLIPYPVLFGVFLYMGFSAIFGGMQMFDRLFLIFKPVKYHPQVSYVRKVKTWKMHLFTAFQFFGLGLLFVIKSIDAIALFFPLFVICMIPLRWSLKFIFTPKELDALDGPKAGQTVKDDEPDFYERTYGS